MSRLDDLPDFCASSRDEWRCWLAENHTGSPGVWLILYKKSSGKARLSYEAAVEEALCFGWIDSKAVGVDAERYRQVFTPRKPRSVWSAPNKRRVAAMIDLGRMTQAGLACVEAAQADGSWNALDAAEALEAPSDLLEALSTCPEAERHFHAFPPGSRKLIIQWILDARRPETRARRIRTTVELAAENRRSRP